MLDDHGSDCREQSRDKDLGAAYAIPKFSNIAVSESVS
ncbi:hypothetical protein DFR70_11599 [Nocardia tenerifensis]|uniref:Uncharacterized protein n=1 Tax=Nocardia tenerifensis TaxID=228006 RepID=A0A318JWW5_9NOCA|nr:hypothetical protein DFR70_11599 [Nocardia tenerifensis]